MLQLKKRNQRKWNLKSRKIRPKIQEKRVESRIRLRHLLKRTKPRKKSVAERSDFRERRMP